MMKEANYWLCSSNPMIDINLKFEREFELWFDWMSLGLLLPIPGRTRFCHATTFFSVEMPHHPLATLKFAKKCNFYKLHRIKAKMTAHGLCDIFGECGAIIMMWKHGQNLC